MPDKRKAVVMHQDMHILIVEDSPTQLEHLRYLLERNQFRVSAAVNGKQALELLENLKPDLVISDIVMPEMTGYELCRTIRANPDFDHLPLVLVTSLADVHDVLKGLECGADNFIRKPYDEKYLLARIDYLLMNRRIRQNQKMQMGMEIYLSGQKHFVNADRQQILDLLISTYEEAVRVKEDLEARQQELINAALYERTHGEVLRLFNSTFDRYALLHGTLDILARNHPFPVSAIYGFDEWNGIYRQEASHTAPSAPHVELRLSEQLIRKVAQDNHCHVLQEPDQHTALTQDAGTFVFSPACIVLCPATYQERQMAILVIVSGRPMNDRDQTFIERIAAQLGVALHNVQQYDDLRLLAGQLRLRSEEISRKNQQLEEASRMKSEFLANMSHELRTPLNAIIGFSEVMRDGLVGELSEQQQEYVSDIFESGQHLLYLINDVLDLSKIEAGKMIVEGEQTQIASLLANCMAIIKERASAHRIRLSIDVPETLGSAWLDPRKVKQIVYNLLSNAVKFTPENGQVSLRARLLKRRDVLSREEKRPEMHTPLPGDHDQYLEIAVSDTGIGISYADMNRLFQPFVQLDSSLSRRFDGTGLGLVMVKKLAALHGGAVAVASLPDEGSTFTVWLPYRTEPQSEATGTVQAAAARTSVAPGNPAPLVLIVEDEYRAADLIRLQLEREGCRTVCAPNAEVALAMLAENCEPDLITLDILLPGMDGWDFLAKLKSEPKFTHIPVVIISIVADNNKGLSLGAADVLQKPITADDLNIALRDLGFVQPGASTTVLVVDDDPRAVEIISAYLENANYTVLRAYSGEEGLQVAQSQQPELIILDLLMPGVSGFEVVEALKSSAKTAQIPVIVLTAKYLSPDDRNLLNGHVLQIVEKSQFNHGSFISEVHRALGKKWQKS